MADIQKQPTPTEVEDELREMLEDSLKRLTNSEAECSFFQRALWALECATEYPGFVVEPEAKEIEVGQFRILRSVDYNYRPYIVQVTECRTSMVAKPYEVQLLWVGFGEREGRAGYTFSRNSFGPVLYPAENVVKDLERISHE